MSERRLRLPIVRVASRDAALTALASRIPHLRGLDGADPFDLTTLRASVLALEVDARRAGRGHAQRGRRALLAKGALDALEALVSALI